MPKPRGRFINFRVTDDELKQLKLACDQQGASCLSAFARTVILNVPIASGEDFGGRLAALDHRISLMELSLSRLLNALSCAAVGASENQT